MSKSIIFKVKSFLSNFYRHLAIFIWSHCLLHGPIWLLFKEELPLEDNLDFHVADDLAVVPLEPRLQDSKGHVLRHDRLAGEELV